MASSEKNRAGVIAGNIFLGFLMLLLVVLIVLWIAELYYDFTTYEWDTDYVDTTVKECEEVDTSYTVIHRMWVEYYTLYMDIPYTVERYEYHITVEYEGTEYTIVRDEPYEIGESVQVKVEKRYLESTGELVEITVE